MYAILNVIKAFDEGLEVEKGDDNDFYLYVKTDKHRFYVGYFNSDEICDKNDLINYLDLINVKEVDYEEDEEK